jgi:hypothetical protein
LRKTDAVCGLAAAIREVRGVSLVVSSAGRPFAAVSPCDGREKRILRYLSGAKGQYAAIFHILSTMCALPADSRLQKLKQNSRN